MLKTQYVTDHEKKVVKAQRGLLGKLRVFLVFAVLSTTVGIAADLAIVLPVLTNCLNSSSTEQTCNREARTLSRGINLFSMVGVSALIANKLNKDALKRYEDLEDKA